MLDQKDNTRYEVFSPGFKQVERRMDACFIPVDDRRKPCLALEFQGYEDSTIYYRALTSAGLMGSQHPDREVHIVIVFLAPEFDPCTLPWHGLGLSGFNGLRVIYLKDVLARISRDNPNDPTAALLGLLLQDDVKDPAADAQTRFQIINAAPLGAQTREVYVKLFLYWLSQRFSHLGMDEVKKMIGYLTPIEETRVYKEIAEKVEAEMKAKYEAELLAIDQAVKKAKAEAEKAARIKANLDEQVKSLKRLHEQGSITDAVFQMLMAGCKSE